MSEDHARALPSALAAVAEILQIKLEIPASIRDVDHADVVGICPLCSQARDENRAGYSYPIPELPAGGASVRLSDLHYLCSHADCPARVALPPETWISRLSGNGGLWAMYREEWMKTRTNGVAHGLAAELVADVIDLETGQLVPAMNTSASVPEIHRRPVPARLTLEDVRNPPRESFILGKMIPLGKTTVIFGPTSGGKSVFLSQLAFAFAESKEELWGQPLLEGGGPVVVYTAEDTFDDWKRKAGAFARAGLINAETAVERVWIIDKSDGLARLSEVVQTRETRDGKTVTKHVPQPTIEQEWLIEDVRACGAKLVIVETASRLVDDEDNANFSALQSALGRIGRETGAAVIVSHHATKKATEDNNSAIESARGGSSLICNARNALALFPADKETTTPLLDRFEPHNVLTLAHGKSTSSTKRQPGLTLVMCDPGGDLGGVLQRPEDAEVTPEAVEAGIRRVARAKEEETRQLNRLFAVVQDLASHGPVSASKLRSYVTQIGVTKNELEPLLKFAIQRGNILQVKNPTGRGFILQPSWDPRSGTTLGTTLNSEAVELE